MSTVATLPTRVVETHRLNIKLTHALRQRLRKLSKRPMAGHSQEVIGQAVLIEDSCSDSTAIGHELAEVKLQGIFDRKEVGHFQIRSLTPQSDESGREMRSL